MIKSIRLQNFEGHRDTLLEFDRGVNSIIGKTDNGKSSIIRAWKWVTQNRPLGDAFVSHWAKTDKKQIEPTIVTIQTDMDTIVREKSSERNGYMLNGLQLEAVGTSVPEEIIATLNIDDINTQFQMDAPFLLSETEGEVARVLNRIVHLDSIDTTLKNIGSMRKEANNERSTLAYELEAVQKEQKEYEHLHDAESLIEQIEMFEEKKEILADKVEDVSDLIQEYKDNQNTIQVEKKLLSATEYVDNMYTYIEQKENIHEQLSSLHTIIQEYARNKEIIDKHMDISEIDIDALETLYRSSHAILSQIDELEYIIQTYTEMTERIDTYSPFVSIDISAIDAAFVEIEDMSRIIDTVEDILDEYITLDNTISKRDREIDLLTEEYNTLMGDTCILCGRAL